MLLPVCCVPDAIHNLLLFILSSLAPTSLSPAPYFLPFPSPCPLTKHPLPEPAEETEDRTCWKDGAGNVGLEGAFT